MTITAYTFALTDSEKGRLLGWGLLSPEARYCSLWQVGAPQPLRQHLSDWRSVEQEIGLGLPAGPIFRDSAIGRLFGTRTNTVLRYLHVMPVSIQRPDQVVAKLDARLQQLALESASGLAH